MRIAFNCKRALTKAIPVQVLIPGVTGLMLLGFFALSNAQQGIVLHNFKVTPGDYFPPPHQKQPKSLLTGQKGEEKAGRYLITGGQFETFLEDGTREMMVEAPSCIYEKTNDHSIHSPGPLRVSTTDEKFTTSGEGFLWQTNSSLFISNRVHTTIRQELLQSNNTARAAFPTNTVQGDNKGIEIFSDHLDYMGETGIGNYRRNVRVTGTNLNMTAGNLQFLLPMRERQLHRMTADENVDLTSGDVRVTGQHVDYTLDDGLIQVTGSPTWQATQREGQADELFIDRSNQVFRATGHALLKLSGQGKGTSAFLPGSSDTNQFVEIRSDRYEIRTNFAEFSPKVTVIDRLGDQTRSTMTCGHLTANFTGTNQMERMVAEENVVMEQGVRRFTAGQAVFLGSNQLLTLTRNPTWQDGPRTGQGDVIFLKGQENELTAQGNALLRLPAANIAPATSSNAPASHGTTNDLAEISSSEYTLSTNHALFQGGVTVKSPQMNLNCKTLTLDSPTSTSRVVTQTLVAQDEVRFTLTTPKGEKINGTAERAVYTYSVDAGKTNDIVELTGNPKLVMEDGSTFENKVILLDQANKKLLAPGKYLVRNFSSPVSTNDFPSSLNLNMGKRRKP